MFVLHSLYFEFFIAITAQGEIEIFTFYQSDFVVVHNVECHVMGGSEGIAMVMEIISPCGFCVYIPRKTTSLPTDKRSSHYGFGTIDSRPS